MPTLFGTVTGPLGGVSIGERFPRNAFFGDDVMAGDWIKMRINLDTNPHVLAMAQELGLPELHIVGALWKVWSWADSHSLDGNALCVTNVTLDRFTGVTGFAHALRKVGWLEGQDGNLSFPRFTEHNGRTAKNRAETAERVAKHRNASVTQKALPEKRREDITGSGPIRRFASQESTASIGNRAALAAIEITPLPRGTITNGQALKSIPDDVSDLGAVAEWWRRHLSSDAPLTGGSALDLLQVLCLATEATRAGGRIKNKAAWFAKRLADGVWLGSSTSVDKIRDWLNDEINAGRIKITKQPQEQPA